MESTSNKRRATPLKLCLAAFVFAAGAPAFAGGANPVQAVDVERDGAARIIRIKTSAEPTFTVFRLSDPMRVVVDVSGGDISALRGPIGVDDGLVTTIATRQFNADGFLIGRLTVGFENDVAYDVRAEGRSVVIRAGPTAGALPRRAVAPPVAPPDPTATERIERAKREAETARHRAMEERREAEAAKSRAAQQLEEARRIAAAAERSTEDARKARAEAAQLRREVADAAQRDRSSLEAKVRSAEKRLATLQGEASRLAREQAAAERLAAEASQAKANAEAAAARAEAMHKEQIAQQQELIASAKAEQARAESEREAAEAARIRAVAAKRDAKRALAQAARAKKEASSAHKDLARKLSAIDAREKQAEQVIAELSKERERVARERKKVAKRASEVEAARETVAAEKARVEKERARLASQTDANAKRERELAAEARRIEAERVKIKRMKARLEKRSEGAPKKNEGAVKASREESERLARLKREIEEQRRALAAQRTTLESKEGEIAKRRDRLAREKSDLAAESEKLEKMREEIGGAAAASPPVNTAELIADRSHSPTFASTRMPDLRRASRLERVKASEHGVLLKFDGEPSYEVIRVEDPPRLVVRLDGVKRATGRRTYAMHGKTVERLRLGDHEHATHAVFDLANAGVQHDVEPRPDGLFVKLDAGARLAKISTAQIRDVRFEESQGEARVVLEVDGEVDAEVDDRSRRAWVLKVRGATLGESLEKSLDTSAYGTAVRMLSAYQAQNDPPVVNVVANLSSSDGHELTREGNKLIWAIRGEAKPAAPTAIARTSARTSAPRTAAFASQAASVASTATPAQTRSQRRVTLDFKDADIINVIRLIADTTGENIIAADDVKGKVTVKLRNVPWERALDVILKSRGYDKVRAGGIIRIATAQSIQEDREREIAKRKAEEQVEDTLINIVTVNYASAAEIVSQIKPLLTGRGTVQVDTRTNALIIEDVGSNIKRLVDLTRVLDKQTPQVLIEARIVEANSNFEQEFGIQWGGAAQRSRANGNPTGLGFPSDVFVSGAADDPQVNPTQGISSPGRYAVNLPAPIGAGAGGGIGFVFGSAGSDQLLQLRLSALESSGTGRIISSPRITTLDNKTAKIAQGVDIPITVVSAAGANTRLIPANLELEVTPHVTNDGSILMAIKASKNEPDFANVGAFGDPSIQRKFAETEILVADGETAVIGGIYTRSTTKAVDEVPFLGKIPVLGWLFRNERETDERSELLVFITPRIVNRDEALRPSDARMGSPG